MKVNEFFKGIQGEGLSSGLPVYFIRTSGCNTKCDFCDSQYAEFGSEVSNLFIMDVIRNSKMENVVFTGGEPLLQIKNIDVILSYLPNLTFHLETNGSIYNDRVKEFNTIACSPKKQLIDNLEAYKEYNKLEETFFKFVYENKNDLWFEKFIKDVGIENNKVWIMPEGATREKQIEKMPEVMEYCLKNNFNFSPRLQILAYDTKRGV